MCAGRTQLFLEMHSLSAVAVGMDGEENYAADAEVRKRSTERHMQSMNDALQKIRESKNKRVCSSPLRARTVRHATTAHATTAPHHAPRPASHAWPHKHAAPHPRHTRRPVAPRPGPRHVE